MFSGAEQGWRSGQSPRLPPMCPGFDSQTQSHMWVEFVGSLPCYDRFFSGYSGFPLPTETDISKFQFDLDYCQGLYQEPLARVMARALPVFDIKFAFTFTNSEHTSVYLAVLVTSVSMKSFIFNYLVRVGCVASVVFSLIYFRMIFSHLYINAQHHFPVPKL